MAGSSARSKALWQDEHFRKKVLAAKQKSSSERRRKFPYKRCSHCKVFFQLFPSRLLKQKFCSKRCFDDIRRGQPNFKNRGRVPSKRAGSGIKGTIDNRIFRSLYELSYYVNVVDEQKLEVKYEEISISLPDGRKYVPDFSSLRSTS